MTDAAETSIHIDAIARLARQAVGDHVETVRIAREGKDVPILIVDQGRSVVPVKPLIEAFERSQPAPFRRRGFYRAADVAGFMAWMDKNSDLEMPVFAEGAEKLSDWKAPKLALVGIANYARREMPGWHDFGARHEVTVSEQWKIWAAAHEKGMTQADFAEFIEARIYDLSSPSTREELSEAITRFIEFTGGDKGASPGKIVELSRGLKITANAKLDQHLNLASGETTLNYHEEHTGGGGRPIKVPQLFFIRIPVFFGEPSALIGVRLRYRLASGSVTWSYSLFAPELVVSAQFEAICERVRKAGRALYLGSPDIPS